MINTLPFYDGVRKVLTDAKIRNLKPKEKQYKASDFGGLFVLVTPSGGRLWKYKYRFEGREKQLALGSYPATSLQDARTRRDLARSLLEQGIDPSAKKKEEVAARLAVTENVFSKFAEIYLDKKRKEGRAHSTLAKLEWIVAEANGALGDMPIRDIGAQDILKVLKRREKKEHYETAKKMRSVIGGVFRIAVAMGEAEYDPTFALKDALIQAKTKHRAAITDKDTLNRFLNALENYGGKTETIIGLKLLILFACRPGEIRKARWHEFDFEERIWTVPFERMKMRRPHFVPLCNEAVNLLKQLQTLTGWGDLLFPAQTSAHKPISENTLNQALRRMGFSPDEVTSHGFRSTFSTFANESGLWNPDAIEAYCARQDTNTVRRAYNRSLYWAERVRIAEWWALELKAVASPDNINL